MAEQYVGRCFELRRWISDEEYTEEKEGISMFKILAYDEGTKVATWENIWKKGDFFIRDIVTGRDPIGDSRKIELTPDEYDTKLRHILNKLFGNKIIAIEEQGKKED